jgi:CRP/FNR family cyclic AMP-dependent transcriptional regulator
MNTTNDKAALKQVGEHPFLRGLSENHLKKLADSAMRVRYRAGDMIFREGDPANRFYLLINGRVTLETHRDEKRIIVQTIGGGDVLGWSWLFAPYYTHFDARVVEPTEAMFFYATPLRDACEEDHDLGYEMLNRIASVLIKRLISAERQLVGRSDQ